MKKTLILLILSICVVECTTYKDFLTQDNICYIDEPIKDAEKYFDINKYNKLLSQEDLTLFENEKIKSIVYQWDGDSIITNKQTNKQTNIIKYLLYGSKGNILYSYSIYEDFMIGKEIDYDQNGNIIKIIDHRQADKYPICYKEALLIVEQKINKRDSITSIRRDEKILKNDTLYYWSVYVKEPDPANGFSLGKSWAYQINAANGKLIKKLRVISNPG